jgi:hypothetical protein
MPLRCSITGSDAHYWSNFREEMSIYQKTPFSARIPANGESFQVAASCLYSSFSE